MMTGRDQADQAAREEAAMSVVVIQILTLLGVVVGYGFSMRRAPRPMPLPTISDATPPRPEEIA